MPTPAEGVVVATMLRRSISAVLLATAACTQVPVADELALADAELDPAAYRSWSMAIPEMPAKRDDAAPEAELEPDDARDAAYRGPRLRVSAFDEGIGEDERTATCPFSVEAEGLPAVSEDATTFAYHIAETLSSSDGEDELVTVRWVDVATDAIVASTVVVDGDSLEGDDRCLRLWRRARVRAGQVNAALAATTWRPLEPFPLGTESLFEGLDDDSADDEGVAADDVEGEPRVELVLRGGEAIVRIPGVKVLERQPVDWRAPDDEVCQFDPVPTEVYADAHTGVVVARVEQYAPPCFCYSETLLHPVALTRQTYDEVLRRGAGAT